MLAVTGLCLFACFVFCFCWWVCFVCLCIFEDDPYLRAVVTRCTTLLSRMDIDLAKTIRRLGNFLPLLGPKNGSPILAIFQFLQLRFPGDLLGGLPQDVLFNFDVLVSVKTCFEVCVKVCFTFKKNRCVFSSWPRGSTGLPLRPPTLSHPAKFLFAAISIALKFRGCLQAVPVRQLRLKILVEPARP